MRLNSFFSRFFSRLKVKKRTSSASPKMDNLECPNKGEKDVLIYSLCEQKFLHSLIKKCTTWSPYTYMSHMSPFWACSRPIPFLKCVMQGDGEL